ncbi:hypothetical protein BIFGAL_04169 [Bifidobacterium gallicum DSM 20093 = LMG 11596]|uniref:Uncharacterized protein n=1 Tax=Bifidobacterium gallicum DSM 20093 = LMG 11596 TaxID=561180 RepID=D1NWC0_9BIFI|nr:hypothetical protein BIFGAL_04169 [Bifidobacterium gallicum DSM 20093 = LMG 11596]
MKMAMVDPGRVHVEFPYYMYSTARIYAVRIILLRNLCGEFYPVRRTGVWLKMRNLEILYS